MVAFCGAFFQSWRRDHPAGFGARLAKNDDGRCVTVAVYIYDAVAVVGECVYELPYHLKVVEERCVFA